ncbi:MAG: hypothetical protein Q7U04_12835, partial [Bacteriovorax sp.]|nr:hypothetical protein [Bacteriovorax sp.]
MNKINIMSMLLVTSILTFPILHADEQIPSPSPTVYNDQAFYYISSNSVKVRSSVDSTGKVLGELSLND